MREEASGTAPSVGVEAVVVDFHAGEALRRCVESLRAGGCASVVVVDNSTSGASRAVVGDDPAVTLLESERNLGFGAGVNAGVALTSTPAVLVCNPDVELRPGALTSLLRRLDAEPHAALIAPALLDGGGRRRPGARPLPSPLRSSLNAFAGLLAPESRVVARHRSREAGLLVSGAACWVPGTCLLVRRAAFDQVQGFDESFFLYLEEVDLCRRLSERGWRVVVEPAAEVLHEGGVSTSRRPLRAVLAYHTSLWRYTYRATTGRERLVLPLAALGIALRCALMVVLGALRSPRDLLAAPAGRTPATRERDVEHAHPVGNSRPVNGGPGDRGPGGSAPPGD